MTKQTITELFDLSAKGTAVASSAMGIAQGTAFRLIEPGAGILIGDIDLEAAKQTLEEFESIGSEAQAVYAEV